MLLDIQQTRIPALGFGTWKLKGQTCLEGVSDALNIGYRHIDTAQIYGNEEEVGQAIIQSDVSRRDIFLGTKVWNNHVTLDQIERSIDESLAKLRTDYVDLLMVHWPVEDARPIPLAIEGVTKALEQGKARAIGVCNFTPDQLHVALEHGPVLCNQIEFHPLFHRGTHVSIAQRHDLMITAYSPLAQGHEDLFENQEVKRIAQAHGKSPAQIAIRWLIQTPHVAAIPRSSSHDHRASNFDVFDFELSPEDMKAIDAIDEQRRLINPSFGPKAWK